MRHKNLSTPRKLFRSTLLALAALSFLFFATIVVFRINSDARHYLMEHTEYLFTFDILQHKAMAMSKDKDGKHDIAVSLVNKGFFSPQYYYAGSEMLKELADKGHAPSQTIHANILLHENATEHKHQAAFYYEMAARQGYEPAQDKLIELYPSY